MSLKEQPVTEQPQQKLKPTTAVSRRTVYAALAGADAAFRRSWKVLEFFLEPRHEEGNVEATLDFQRQLLTAITALEGVYRRISQEQKRLIQHKGQFHSRWFARRMAVLSGHLTSIEDVLAIGRAIGDGFAWVFYERDRPLLLEHCKYWQKLLPPGLGALGERLTVENMRGVDGKFLLYHGITTLLRMGDVSLVDLSTLRVACIGELKTTRVANVVCTVQLAFVAGDPQKLPKFGASAPRRNVRQQLPEPVAARFKRQIRRMSEALGRVKSGPCWINGLGMQ